MKRELRLWRSLQDNLLVEGVLGGDTTIEDPLNDGSAGRLE